MEDKPTTFGSSHDRLARLWKIGNDAQSDLDDPYKEHKREELLRDRLAEHLPLDPTASSMLSAALGHVLEHFAPFVGFSLGAMLNDSNTDPSVIWQIKERYKEKAKFCSSELEREVATIIYYAAIANALTYHGARITKLSYESLGQSFSELAKSNWLPPDLKQLFSDAHKGCSQRMGRSGE
jgi:hypothetical protein